MSRRFFFNLQGLNESLNFTSNTHTIANLYMSGGNIGINTTNPSVTLDINGTLRATNANVTTLTAATLLNTNAVSTNISAASGVITNMINTGLTSNNAQLTNANVTTLTAATLLNTNAVSTNISAASGVITNMTHTGLTSNNAQLTNANVTTLTAATLLNTNLTSTAISVANIAVSGNLSVGGTLTTVNMTTTNLIDTNITAGSANITNANVNGMTVGSLLSLNSLFVGTTSLNNPTSLLVQNSSGTAELALAAANGHYSSNSIRGDTVIRSGNTTANMMLQIGGANAMIYLASSGNVGIGTNAPTDRLHVSGDTRVSGLLQTGNLKVGSNGVIATEGAYLQWNKSSGSGETSLINQRGAGLGYINFGQATTSGSFTEQMRIAYNGLVGIGTTAPAATLDVNGSGRFNGNLNVIGPGQATTLSDNIFFSLAAYDSINSDGSKTVYSNSINLKAGDLTWGGGAVRIPGAQIYIGGGYSINAETNNQGEIKMSTSTTERLRITGDGSVRIGTAAGTFTGSGSKLAIDTAGASDGMYIKASSDNNYIIAFFNSAGAGAFRGAIQGNGASAVSYNTTSDKRKKTNIQNMSSMIDKIKELKPRTYNWIEDNQEGFGFVAQEVHTVFPQFRNNNRYPDSDPENPVDAEGNPAYYGLDYGQFTPYLTKALQETIELVESQKQIIDSLEARLTALEQK